MEIRIDRKLVLAFAALAVAPWLVAASIEAASGDDDTRVDIVGYGSAPQETRFLSMRAGVSSFATTASRAIADNAATMAAIRRQLARHGIDPKDVRTGELSLQPTTRREDPNRDHQVRGFEVRHVLTVAFRDVGKTGAVMDTLVAAGATEIGGPRFSHEAAPEAQSPARLAAIRDADQRAQFYAKALGMKVKRVVTMRDGGGHAAPEMAVSRAVAPGTEVSLGSDQVRVAVFAQYELTR